MKKLCRRATPLFAAAVLAVAAGCATQTAGEQVPGWVVEPPEDTAETVYFSASAAVAEDGTPAATQRATNAIISEIVRYLGVRIESSTTAEARASLDSFETRITQQVTEQSEARVEGFRIVDRYVHEQDGRQTLYLLAAYDRSALEQERQRLQSLFRERVAEVETPASEAERLEARGQLYAAALRYLTAAAAAASSDIDNADVKLRDYLRAATRLLSELQLTAETAPETLQLNEPVTQPFRAVVHAGSSEQPVAGADVEVSYRIIRRNGRVGIETRSVKSNSRGEVVFTPPAPQSVGEQTLTMSLDLSAALQPLTGLRNAAGQQLDSLQRIAARKRVSFRYDVVSQARSIPTAVIVLERDAAGNSVGTARATAGIVSVLSNAGFTVQRAAVEASAIEEGDPVSALRDALGDSVQRAIYGTVAIDSFTEDDGILVRVTGQVHLVSLESGELLYSANGLQYSRGQSAQSTLSAAFRSIGEQLGNKLANGMP